MLQAGRGEISDHKKSILTKLFKGQQPQPFKEAGVSGSFHEQLNQTNYGFNPQRQTLVAEVADRQLNTGRRNRTQPLTGEARGPNMHDLYSAHMQKPSSQGGSGVSNNARVNPHQQGFDQFGGEAKQLFLPATMKAQLGVRKALNTQNQQHRAHSHG